VIGHILTPRRTDGWSRGGFLRSQNLTFGTAVFPGIM
jgi:hypothetical protein